MEAAGLNCGCVRGMSVLGELWHQAAECDKTSVSQQTPRSGKKRAAMGSAGGWTPPQPPFAVGSSRAASALDQQDPLGIFP